jgi:hypothetical protein
MWSFTLWSFGALEEERVENGSVDCEVMWKKQVNIFFA